MLRNGANERENLAKVGAEKPRGKRTIAELEAAIEGVAAGRQLVKRKLGDIGKRHRAFMKDWKRPVQPADIRRHDEQIGEFMAEIAACQSQLKELDAAEEALQAQKALLHPLQKRIDTAEEGKLDEYCLTIAKLQDRVDVIVDRRGENARESEQLWKAGRGENVSLDARAARRHAQELVDGIDRPRLELSSAPVEASRERVLICEREGIDLALRILRDQMALAESALASAWCTEVNGVWREHMREVVRIRNLSAAKDRLTTGFIARCPGDGIPRLPLVEMLDDPEIDLVKLNEAAIKEGIITPAEVKDAQHG
jgi:hypothetical protein